MKNGSTKPSLKLGKTVLRELTPDDASTVGGGFLSQNCVPVNTPTIWCKTNGSPVTLTAACKTNGRP